MSGEFARIAELRKIYEAGDPASSAEDGVELGIGDDAAVLAWPVAPLGGPHARVVWTVDEQVEGTHFDLAYVDYEDVGYRAFMAAASDVAAMCATPWCALSSLVVPASLPDAMLYRLARGTAEAARAIGARVVGGNLTRGPALTVTTSVMGRAACPVTRAGARPGDGLYVAGPLGLATLGFRALSARGARTSPTMSQDLDPAVRAFLRPTARTCEGERVASRAHAAVDVSDGLAADAGHLASASGVAVVLDATALLAHGGDALLAAARALGVPPLEPCLHGGEDYALLVAAPADTDLEGFTRIGDAIAGEGVHVRDRGETRSIPAKGFDHFA